jgi:hypothetical protein
MPGAVAVMVFSLVQATKPPCAPGIPVTDVCPLLPTSFLPEDVAGTRSVGMGDAFRGVGTSNDTIVDNPAGLILNPHYEIAGFFGYSNGAETSTASGGPATSSGPATYWNASVGDSLSLPPLSIGIAYNHLGSGTGIYRFTGWDLRLALALPIGDVVGIGVSGNFLSYNSGAPATGQPYGPPFTTFATTGNVALQIHPTELVTVAVIGYNLIDINSPLTPAKIGFGAAVGTDTTFRFDVDILSELNDNPHVDAHIGGEYFAGNIVAIRAGYSYLGLLNQNYASVGVGVIVPGFALELAYRLELIQWNDNLFVAGIKFFFNNS